jgi:hypothetical protein
MLPLPLAVPKDAPRCQGLGPRVDRRVDEEVAGAVRLPGFRES